MVRHQRAEPASPQRPTCKSSSFTEYPKWGLSHRRFGTENSLDWHEISVAHCLPLSIGLTISFFAKPRQEVNFCSWRANTFKARLANVYTKYCRKAIQWHFCDNSLPWALESLGLSWSYLATLSLHVCAEPNGSSKQSSLIKWQFFKRESIIREELVREQDGRLHANPSALEKTCCKRERHEATEPVRSTREEWSSKAPVKDCEHLHAVYWSESLNAVVPNSSDLVSSKN